MSFKRKLTYGIALGCLILGGCAIGEKSPAPAPLSLGSDETACLDGASQTLADYLDGKLTNDAKITAIGDCASNALKKFSEEVRGSISDAYTPEELREFIQHYFVKDVQITDDLLSRTMELKQVLVGGANNQVTRAEINLARNLIRVIQNHAIALRPYFPFSPSQVGSQPIQNVSKSTLLKAGAALEAAGGDIATIIQTNGSNYTFSQVNALMQAIQNAPAMPGFASASSATRAASRAQLFQKARDYLNLIRQFESNFIGPDSDQLASNDDWHYAIATASHWYELLVRAGWLVNRGIPLNEGEGLDEFHDVLTQVLKLSSSAVQRHRGGFIPYDEMNRLIDALPDGALPKPFNAQPGDGVTRDTIKELLPTIAQRFFGGRDLGNTGRLAQGLTTDGIARFQLALDRWYRGQKLLEDLYIHLAAATGAARSPFEATFTRDELLSADYWNPIRAGSAEEVLAANRLQTLIGLNQPLIFNGDDPMRPMFNGDDGEITYRPGLKFSFHDLSDLSWKRELARFMIEGYAEDPDRADSDSAAASVTFSEFDRFFKDLTNLGLQLKFFNPHTLASTSMMRFREANLFTFAGNGDTYMDLREATQMLAQLFSAKRLSSDIYNHMAATCTVGALDDYNYLNIASDCYRAQMLAHYADFFHNMPGLVKYLNQAGPGGRKAFFADVELAARSDKDVGWTNSDVSDHSAALMQYVELTYSRFDLNGDGYLTQKEAADAFPIFRHTLNNLATCQGEKLSDTELKTVFGYMLSQGEMPKGIWQFIGEWLERHILLQDYHADRSRIVKIFSAISSSGPATPVPNPNPACLTP